VDWTSQRSCPVVACDASADEPPDTKELLTVLLENLVVAQLAKKLSFVLRKLQDHYRVHRRTRWRSIRAYYVGHLSTSCLHDAASPVRPVSWRMKQKLSYFIEKKSVPTTSPAQDCHLPHTHLQATPTDRTPAHPSKSVNNNPTLYRL
jgi:hypothetical protein